MFPDVVCNMGIVDFPIYAIPNFSQLEHTPCTLWRVLGLFERALVSNIRAAEVTKLYLPNSELTGTNFISH